MIFHGHPRLLKVVRPGSPLNEEPRPTLLYKANKVTTLTTLTGPQVTLAIDDLGPGDEGEYACKAENPWGDTTCTLLVGGFSIAPLLKSIFAKNAST